MIFVAGRAFCQKKTALTNANSMLFYYKQSGLKLHIVSQIVNNSSTAIPISSIKPFANIPVISADYYSSNLGFFCKKEIQLEKTTKLPFKFRLGSVQQCDRLEGKTTAITQ